MGAVICEQGDVVSINFDPSKGHEPAYRHYGVVLSPWRINKTCALMLMVPVTSVDNGYPLHVKIAAGNPVRGFVQCEAVRAMDLGVREAEGAAEVVGSLDDGTLAQVMATVLVVLGLEEF
ncbi:MULTISPECIES: type II toxin-antitoxin system PemK/MazF family toxin [unclassified Adlercreutzia]|uniref:type II toxin-antitoxin system PemK/MazF family toxin n=1 Tax=unclassified Adlercreutzia TaxID=2636013 RepID=UPI001F14CEE4|nr:MULTISPECIES: type II toxin-antitoxin system PemK/MazF family toxin [unclassified Adlercreutzia]